MNIRTILNNIKLFGTEEIATKRDIDTLENKTATALDKVLDRLDTLEECGEQGPEIDREFEKEKRLDELKKQVKNYSIKQLSWICDIELDLEEAPRFTGETVKACSIYIDTYKMKHNIWKHEHGISRAI